MPESMSHPRSTLRTRRWPHSSAPQGRHPNSTPVGTSSWVERDGARLPEDEYSSWSPEETMDFLRGRCHLTGKLPGWVIEHHDEAFARWRDAVGDGMLVPPFHVTHIDAHADLGLGDAGYVHLI